jgi:uncharacterized protein YjbI with pentapeptide repeats
MLLFMRMSPRTASSPQSPDLPSELEPGNVSVLAHDGTYRDIELSDLALAEARANGVTFHTTRLVNVDVSASQLDDLRLTQRALKGCNLANTQAQRAAATRVTVETSRLTGIDLREATLRDVTFRDCRSDLTGLEGIESLRGAAMEWSDIIEMTGALAAALGIEILAID